MVVDQLRRRPSLLVHDMGGAKAAQDDGGIVWSRPQRALLAPSLFCSSVSEGSAARWDGDREAMALA